MTHQGPTEGHEPDIYDLGLQADLAMWQHSPIERRQLLKLGALGLGTLLAASGANAALAAGNTVSDLAAACVTTIPQETAGPYPADGSQASNTTLNALALSGIVRQDIRTSLGTGNTAPGIPATIELTLLNSTGDCEPLAGYALYAWHCDRAGNYSLYSNGVTNEDYLRGVQVADASGKLRFTTIFPACYSGRWPHVHFEVYPTLEGATAASNAILTSQLALPKEVCDTVYATPGYEQSVRDLAQLTLETDNIFSDGYSQQLATVTGDVATGYTISLTVGVDPAGTNQGGSTPGGGPGGPGGAPPPTGLPMPSGMPQPSGTPAPASSASPAPSASASPAPSAIPGLPNTGDGGGNGPASWAIATPLVALAALLVPFARRLRRR
jgi:protocatechuate 3,4-dioxygenase beta subunit